MASPFLGCMEAELESMKVFGDSTFSIFLVSNNAGVKIICVVVVENLVQHFHVQQME